MTPQEFRAARESLGLDREWLADHLDVRDRTVARWEDGDTPPRPFAVEALEQLVLEADAQVAEHVASFTDRATRLPAVMAIDTSAEGAWPARWQRAIALRVQCQVPGLMILSAGQLQEMTS